jgi:hypothetical protein
MLTGVVVLGVEDTIKLRAAMDAIMEWRAHNADEIRAKLCAMENLVSVMPPLASTSTMGIIETLRGLLPLPVAPVPAPVPVSVRENAGRTGEARFENVTITGFAPVTLKWKDEGAAGPWWVNDTKQELWITREEAVRRAREFGFAFKEA